MSLAVHPCGNEKLNRAFPLASVLIIVDINLTPTVNLKSDELGVKPYASADITVCVSNIVLSDVLLYIDVSNLEGPNFNTPL
ncbi:MAG: hypothetical protein ACKPKO_26165, partial [Candidatus Fonsibacter sp.]